MAEIEALRHQARKCRVLAGGLSNRDDIRKLEELAHEFEARARAVERAAGGEPAATL